MDNLDLDLEDYKINCLKDAEHQNKIKDLCNKNKYTLRCSRE